MTCAVAGRSPASPTSVQVKADAEATSAKVQTSAIPVVNSFLMGVFLLSVEHLVLP
jgi:hypothetical protein